MVEQNLTISHYGSSSIGIISTMTNDHKQEPTSGYALLNHEGDLILPLSRMSHSIFWCIWVCCEGRNPPPARRSSSWNKVWMAGHININTLVRLTRRHPPSAASDLYHAVSESFLSCAATDTNKTQSIVVIEIKYHYTMLILDPRAKTRRTTNQNSWFPVSRRNDIRERWCKCFIFNGGAVWLAGTTLSISR